MIRSHEHASGKDAFKCFVLSFKNKEMQYQLEFKLITKQQDYQFQITIIQGRNLHQQYEYYKVFTIENIPKEFVTIYETLPELYEYIASNYLDSMEIEFNAREKNIAVIRIKVLIIKKIKKMTLKLDKRKLQEEKIYAKKLQLMMKEKQNKMEQKERLLSEIKHMEGQLLQAKQKNLEQQKQKKKLTIQSQYIVGLLNKKMNENDQTQKRIALKKEQIEELYIILQNNGIDFTKHEQLLYGKALNKKRMVQDANTHFFENRLRGIYIQEQIPLPSTKDPEYTKITKFPLQIKALNLQNKENKRYQPLFHHRQQSKNEKRSLRLNDQQFSSDKINSQNQQKLQKQLSLKDAAQQQLDYEQIISLKANNQFLNQKNNNMVTVLSSESDNDDLNFYNSIGEKVELDFSHSEHIRKYRFERQKNKMVIERVDGDRKFYLLHHRDRIIGTQYVQYNISKIQKHDFNFGIIIRDAMIEPRLIWSKYHICLAGSLKSIISKFQQKQMKLPLRDSDIIILSVDISKRAINFYHNKSHISKEQIPEEMIDNCYFFIETATKGNRIYLV